jgi:hypothetical protein
VGLPCRLLGPDQGPHSSRIYNTPGRKSLALIVHSLGYEKEEEEDEDEEEEIV